MLRGLYNSGAEINIVNQGIVDYFSLNYSLFHSKPVATFIDCNQLRLGKPYELTLYCYNLILGYPWLWEANPKIHFS